MRECFIFYKYFYTAICELPENTQLKILKGLIEYGLFNKETNSCDSLYNSVMSLIKTRLDKDRDKRYIKIDKHKNIAQSKDKDSISQKTRFNVFDRDSFTCQYCGAKAPDVELELDHIHPVSRGGENNVKNLITSCLDCNRGKSNKILLHKPNKINNIL